MRANPTRAWSGLAITVPLKVVTWASRSSAALDASVEIVMCAVLKRKRALGVGALTSFLIASFYPIESTVVPKWRLQVVDEQGRGCPGAQVNQGWKHYSLDLEAGDYGEYKSTDADGYVEFPERTIRAGLIRRLVAPMIAHALVIAHGSTGISGYVFASGMKEGPWLNYTPGQALPDKIHIDRCPDIQQALGADSP